MAYNIAKFDSNQRIKRKKPRVKYSRLNAVSNLVPKLYQIEFVPKLYLPKKRMRQAGFEPAAFGFVVR